MVGNIIELFAIDDYVMATEHIEALVKDIQRDYNDWRESHKIYEI